MLDNETGDLVFINGKTPVTSDRAGAIQQRLRVKLLTFLGEWFLETTYGIPYFQSVFGKQRDKATVDSIFQAKILEEDGVIRIESFQSSLTTDRIYYLVFQVVVDDGSTTGNIIIGIDT